MRVFGWIADRPACEYYRVRLPFSQLAKQCHQVDVARLLLGARHTSDVIVGQGLALPDQSFVWRNMCRERTGCVYDMDDDLFSVTPDNKAAYPLYSDPAIQDHIRRNLAAAHVVTVTNERLARIAQEFNDNVAILPNCIPGWLLEHQPQQWPFPVIGWAGGDSHARDFGEIAKPLRRYLQAHPDVAFHCVGADYTARVKTLRSNVAHSGWTNNTESYLRSIDFTVGLAPLRDTVFARSKSPLKALELAALGIPCIASNIPPYSKFVLHGVTGFLVNNGREFEAALAELVGDPELRAEMGRNARRQAAKHTIEQHGHLWAAAYAKAMEAR